MRFRFKTDQRPLGLLAASARWVPLDDPSELPVAVFIQPLGLQYETEEEMGLQVLWVQVEGYPRVDAIADEDLARENDTKTSAVHFLRFELDDRMRQALKHGVSLAIGVDHPECLQTIASVDPQVRASLAKDLA